MIRTLLTCLALLTTACHRVDLEAAASSGAGDPAETTPPGSVAAAEQDPAARVPEVADPAAEETAAQDPETRDPETRDPGTQDPEQSEPDAEARVATFKSTTDEVPFLNGQALLARDPATGDLGICYVSAIPGAAAYVPAGRAGVGVVTVTGKSQAHWQSTVLDRLAAGESPEAIVADLTQDDLSNRTRQIGIVGFDGKAATFTGPANLKLSASVSGDGFAIVLDQARDLTVVDEIEEAFRESAGLPLPERLLAAIAASAQIDGTGRPYLSGCLLVYREGGGPDGETDRFVDIRVDFDLDVIEKLKTIYATTVTVFTGPRLRKLHKALFDTSNPLYKANRDWLKRLRTPHEVGVLKRD